MPAERPDPLDSLRALRADMGRVAVELDMPWPGDRIEQWCVVLGEILRDLDNPARA